jgi:hypothetical protein
MGLRQGDVRVFKQNGSIIEVFHFAESMFDVISRKSSETPAKNGEIPDTQL